MRTDGNKDIKDSPASDASVTNKEDVITREDANSTTELTMDTEPKQNMQPFRETLTEFEMLAKAGNRRNDRIH
jgi:hypothetical protein